MKLVKHNSLMISLKYQGNVWEEENFVNLDYVKIEEQEILEQ